jgi:hypothetical protein
MNIFAKGHSTSSFSFFLQRGAATSARIVRRISMGFCLLWVCSAVVCTTPALGQNWTNATGNQNFADFGNWSGGLSSFTGSNRTWTIDFLGADRAELFTAVGDVQRDLFLGVNPVGKGELFVGTNGSMTITRNLRVGETGGEGTMTIEGGTVGVIGEMRLGRQGGTDGFGIVTINGGSLNVGQDLFTGQSDRAQNVFTLNSGTVTVGGILNVAHQANNQSTVNIAGGRFTVGGTAVFSDGGSAPSTSVLNLSGGGELDIVGSASFANNNGGATSTVTIQDNATLRAGSLRVGFGANSTAIINIEGGLIDVPGSFVTFGQGVGSTTTVTMSGGVLNADRINWGNDAAATATLNMSSGVINVVRQPDSTNSTSGAFGLQAGNPQLDLSGDALVNAERLLINNGGTLTLGGDAIMNVTGATDGRATLDFSIGLVPPLAGGGWSNVNGTINFSSLDSVLQVTGTGQTITEPSEFSYNFVNLFNQAIANGVITQSVGPSPEFQFLVAYDELNNLTTVSVVPEPSTVAVLGGAVVLLGVGWRRRRK